MRFALRKKIECHLLANSYRGNSLNLEGPFGELEKTPAKTLLQTWKYFPQSRKRRNPFPDICIIKRSTHHGLCFQCYTVLMPCRLEPPRSIDRIGRPNDGYTGRKVLHACAEPVSKPRVLEGAKKKPSGPLTFLVSSKIGKKS